MSKLQKIAVPGAKKWPVRFGVLAFFGLLSLAACQAPIAIGDSGSTVTKSSADPAPAQSCPPQAKAMSPTEARQLMLKAKDRGVLYRVTSTGAIGYLYGTIHMSRRDWIFPGPKTMEALRSSKVLALELNVFDPEVNKKITAKTSGATQKTVQMPAGFEERVEKLAKRVCAPLEKIRSMPSSLLMPTLLAFDARFEGLDAGYGSEAFLYGFAKQSKMPITSLETVETQTAVLGQGEKSDEDHRRSTLRVLENLESGKSRKSLVEISNAWANGDLDAIARGCPDCTPELMKKLNDDRNVKMAAGIDKLLREENKPGFIGVGVLHMVGPKALPKLLRERGYTVERIKFDNPD